MFGGITGRTASGNVWGDTWKNCFRECLGGYLEELLQGMFGGITGRTASGNVWEDNWKNCFRECLGVKTSWLNLWLEFFNEV